MSGPVLRLRTRSWHGDIEQDFPLPDGWTADVAEPAGAPALEPGALAAAFERPIEAPLLDLIVGSGSRVTIVVDDLARPTPAEPLCTALMDALNRAGVDDGDVTLLAATGAHKPLSARELRVKLGSCCDRAGRCLSHDCFSDDVAYLGATARGTPVLVNRAVADADLVVAICCVYPNAFVGFGGGAKLILPGVSHISAIHWLHARRSGCPPGGGRACAEADMHVRREIEDVGARAGLRLAVCAVVDARRELCGCFVGDPVAAHRAAIPLVRRVGRTRIPPDARYDLVIANTYPIDGEPTQVSKSNWPLGLLEVPALFVADFVRPEQYHGWYDGPYDELTERLAADPPAEQDAAAFAHAQKLLFCPAYGTAFRPHRRDWYCENDWERLMDKLTTRWATAHALALPAAPLQWATPGAADRAVAANEEAR